VNAMRIAFLIGMTTILATTLPAQTFTVLHNFELTDGQNPLGMLTNDSKGNLYGTTEFGGDVTNESEGNGVVFQLANRNGTWQESVLHKFSDGSDGGDPENGLIAGPGGNGYATAPFGGSFTPTNCNLDGGCGTVYQMGRNGSFSVVYSFTGAPDGQHPFSALLAGANGLLYGTTEYGGNLDCPFNSFGCGTVFQVNANGAEQLIYSFLGPDNNSDGANPFSALIKDAAGSLYGGTVFGGTINNNNCEPDAGCGTIFELTPGTDGSWTETVLYRFQGGADGDFPAVSLFDDADGSIYGTTPTGGNLSACGGAGCGTIFKLTNTNGQWTKTVVYAFSGSDGDAPISPLTRDTAGNLYGATAYGGNLNCTYYEPGCGVVFKVDPRGKETVLHTFSGTDGLFPGGGVLVYGNALYGTTIEGGDIANCSLDEYYTGCGVVYEISR
jgi:uncharacterized repeat protein (TIGR03803 family)